MTLPRPGHADLAGTLKYGLADTRDALERASARQTALTVAAGAVAKALLAQIGAEVAGAMLEMGDVDEAKADRDTVGGVVEVRARGVPAGPRLVRDERGPARRAARGGPDGDPGGEGRRDRRRVRAREAAGLRGPRRDLPGRAGLYRETNHAGGIEGGVSNGEEIVVRAAMKPLPTLMRPLRSVDLETGEPAEALVERSDVAAVEALSGRRRGLGRLRARAGRPREVRRRLDRGLRRSPSRVPGADRLAAPLDRHLALIGFMGAGKSRLGAEVAQRLGRPFVDLDREIESASGRTIPELFIASGEPAFRVLEAEAARRALRHAEPTVIALGGGAVETDAIVNELRDRAVTALVEIDVDEAWRRVGGTGRPLAADESSFRALFERRAPVYGEVADAVVGDADDAVLAAGGVQVELGGIERLASILGEKPVALVADAHVAGIHGAVAQLALGPRLAETHELPRGEEAKTLEAVERLWRALRLPRGGALVALGGGSVTDAAGFVAATYLRGIPWVAVPTTLVGQVDAGIGGKTAIDLPEGKNLVGAFHWPTRTVIDPGLLATLPPEERSEGMAEVVKTGLLAGESLWELPDQELVRR